MSSAKLCPHVLSILFPRFKNLSAENALKEVQYILEAGSSGERCLAQVALDLLRREGFLSDLLHLLDDASFERLIAVFVALRKN